MGRAMVFGVVIRIIISLAPFPIVPKLFLVTFVPHEPTIHVDRLGCLGVKVFGYKTMCCGVVRLDWGGGLRVTHLFE